MARGGVRRQPRDLAWVRHAGVLPRSSMARELFCAARECRQPGDHPACVSRGSAAVQRGQGSCSALPGKAVSPGIILRVSAGDLPRSSMARGHVPRCQGMPSARDHPARVLRGSAAVQRGQGSLPLLPGNAVSPGVSLRVSAGDLPRSSGARGDVPRCQGMPPARGSSCVCPPGNCQGMSSPRETSSARGKRCHAARCQ